jgi:DedD protein
MHSNRQFENLVHDPLLEKSKKTKSLLTITALVIIILIVAIILGKLVFNTPQSEQLIIDENHIEKENPELTLQPSKEEQRKEALLSMQKSPLAPESTQAPQESQTTTLPKPVVKTAEPQQKPIIHTKPAPKPEPTTVPITSEFQQVPPKVHKPKPAPKKEVKREKTSTSKATKKMSASELLAQASQRPQGRPLNQRATPKATHGSYYIQVGSFRQTPSQQFLNIIQKSGFHYHITPPQRNGIKKLLIGPYATKEESQRALPRVKDRINKRAFIIKR